MSTILDFPGRPILATLGLLFAVPCSAQSVSWGPEEQVGPGGLDFLRPRIHLAVDGSPVVVWGDDGTHSVRAARSTGGGAWLMTEVDALVQGHPYVSDWTGPETDHDQQQAWAVYASDMNGPLYLHHFVDGLPSAIDTLRIDPPVGHQYTLPSVASLPNGEAAVLVMSTATGGIDPEYILLRTTNGGTAFLPPVPVSAAVAPGEVCDCCTGSVQASGNTVVALFRNNDSNLRTILAAISTDGGATFTNAAEVDPTGWTVPACPSSGPAAHIVGDSLRLVWMSGAVNGTKSYGRSVHLPALVPGPLVELHPGQPLGRSQNFPRIAGSGDTLGVVWQQGQSGQFEILFRWSVNGWAGLSAPDTVHDLSAGAQKNPDIFFQNGNFHLVWQDSPSATVHYRRATVVNDVGVTEQVGEDVERLWPVPTSTWINIPATLQGNGYVVHDAMGRAVMEGVLGATIDVHHLLPGPYGLRSGTRSGRPFALRFMVVR